MPSQPSTTSSKPTSSLSRGSRFLGISLSVTLAGQILLSVGIHAGLDAIVANIIAVVVTTVVAYEANLRITWAGHTRRFSDMIGFFAIAVIGLIGSTIAVSWAVAEFGVGIAANIASLTVWGSLWLGRFIVFERVVANHHATKIIESPTSDVDAGT